MKSKLKNNVNKKILTLSNLKKELYSFFKNFPFFASIYLKKRIDKQFIRKIMIAVTEVNGCTYCSWFHKNMALILGEMDTKAIEKILKIQYGKDVSEHELIGLAYAQHYAVTNRQPDPEARKIFFDFYGNDNGHAIIAIINMIFFGNLVGNTMDTIISLFNIKQIFKKK